jgi:hypothetical protein
MSQTDPGYYVKDSTIGGQAAGKGFFSNKALKSGESIVMVPRPTMASLESERLKDTCANCYDWTEGSSIGSRLYVKEGTTVQMCAGCKRFRYCSKVHCTTHCRASKFTDSHNRHVKKKHGTVVTSTNVRI